MTNERILNLPPDLYSRNYIISQGIKEFKKVNNLEKVTILDIGGRGGKMDLFIDAGDELLLLDIRHGDEKNLIIGDAVSMKQFKDGEFDIIVSGDVFEHIPPEKRELFLKESMRVAKRLIILAAPFDERNVRESEMIVNNFYKKIAGTDHEWLKEHIECGLPEKAELEKILLQNGYNFQYIKSNNLDNWVLLQKSIALAYNFGLDISSLYEFYNVNLLKVENGDENFYRRVYFISKTFFDPKITYSFEPDAKNRLKEKMLEFITVNSIKIGKNNPITNNNKQKMQKNIIRNFYAQKIKKHIPRFIFEKIINPILDSNLNRHISSEKGTINLANFVPTAKKFPESVLAHKYLDGLFGLEIGGSAHNSFGLKTKNVDYSDEQTKFKKLEIALCGEAMHVDIIAPGDNIPIPDESEDFVISSHVLEHFPDPIKAMKEWYRIIKPGGYIFMIIPHKERTFDKKRERTTLDELIRRHETSFFPKINIDDHYSFWITQDIVDLTKYLGWKIVETQDIDDKAGNGFTIVIQKES